MKKSNLFLAACFLTVGMYLTSCEKENGVGDTSGNELTTSIDDDAITDAIFDDVIDEADDVANEKSFKSASVDSGMGTRTTTVEIINDSTRVITIDFVNFRNPRGKSLRIKNGRMVMRIEGERYTNTYRRILTFENFTINDNEIYGTKTIEKIGDYQYKITLENGKVVFGNGLEYTRSCERIRTQTAGTETPFFLWDDTFEITGTAEGVNRRGESYSREITEPLVKVMAWRYFVEGKVDITIGEDLATLDYGDGEYDNLATITINGEVYTIELKR